MRTERRERPARRIRAPGLACCALLSFACASQAPPPGGPPDRTPPGVVRTWPGPDTAGVPADAPLLVQFTEPMDRRSVEEAVFLSPAPAGGLRFRWRGTTLEARPAAPLAPDRTYLVSVGTGCRDEAGNPMAASRDFAFSTGARIAGGEIRGHVSSPEGGGGQVFVLAYQLTAGPDPDPTADPPDFTTQTGSDGGFRFPRLGGGRYRIFAFEDRDRDRSPTPGIDPLAVPPADVALPAVDTAAVLGDLRPLLRDAGPPVPISARAPDGTHVLVGFRGPAPDSVRLSIRGVTGRLDIRAIRVEPADPTRALFLTSPQVRGETYRVIPDTTGNGIRAGDPIEPPAFRGSGDPDRSAPRVVSTLPPSGAEGVRPDVTLELRFSEPMETADPGSLWIASDTTAAPAGRFRWAAADRLVFTPSVPWSQARHYRLTADPRSLADPAGNRPAGVPELRFTTLDSARLGGISGRVFSDDSGTPVRIEANRMGDPPIPFTARLPGPGAYSLDGLPPGAYRVTAFLDRDGDGAWGAGRARPFRPSEPFRAHSDSVTVRPRWVTDGIDLHLDPVRFTGRPRSLQP